MDVRERLLKKSQFMEGLEREEYIDFLNRLFESVDRFDGKQPHLLSKKMPPAGLLKGYSLQGGPPNHCTVKTQSTLPIASPPIRTRG